MAEQTSDFTGWAKVEMMGHNVEIGYVTTRYFGPAALFQIDVPGIPEREETLERPEYAGVEGHETWCPSGSVVKRAEIPSRTSMIGPSTIYRMTPCSEEVAKKALSDRRGRPFAIVHLASRKELEAEYPANGLYEEDKEDVEIS